MYKELDCKFNKIEKKVEKLTNQFENKDFNDCYDDVYLKITDKRINQNDNQIKSIGKLIDIATDDEVNKFFGSKINKYNDPDVSGLQDSDTIKNNDTESNFII